MEYEVYMKFWNYVKDYYDKHDTNIKQFIL